MERGQFYGENKLRMFKKKKAKLSVYFYFPEHKFLRLRAQWAVQMPNLKMLSIYEKGFLYSVRTECIVHLVK